MFNPFSDPFNEMGCLKKMLTS